jgi:hypothetical protein
MTTARVWRVPNREQHGCDWCGEDRPTVFSFFDTQADARDAVVYDHLFAAEAFCSLHCWGQANGRTDL